MHCSKRPLVLITKPTASLDVTRSLGTVTAIVSVMAGVTSAASRRERGVRDWMQVTPSLARHTGSLFRFFFESRGHIGDVGTVTWSGGWPLLSSRYRSTGEFEEAPSHWSKMPAGFRRRASGAWSDEHVRHAWQPAKVFNE